MLWKSLLTSIRSTVLRVPGRSVCVSVAGRAAAASKAAPTQQLDLGGVYPPMPTPFLKDEAIAYDQLASNVGVWSTMPFRGAWYLSRIASTFRYYLIGQSSSC
ncbi:4-hydroxy-2-oxoglutarate aldolase, mitochondrial [Portunus trituberculatus]|uniref:4-hydroxy-2-oxoglutarate aldolase, mitochondrial n=1 Tax=Portunus trituberculatus TaxID=210409 RepID=A0A5B7DEX0_PORTR|nr:4-hydroxy-2-oxoglutarate aldolase, mitochondrial [Portunus trituberculatus]